MEANNAPQIQEKLRKLLVHLDLELLYNEANHHIGNKKASWNSWTRLRINAKYGQQFVNDVAFAVGKLPVED